MPLIETLVAGLGTEIVKSILIAWSRNSALGQAAHSSLEDMIGSITPKFLTQQRGKRQFEAIAERVAEEMLPVFERWGIPESRQEQVAWEAQQRRYLQKVCKQSGGVPSL